MLYRAIVRYKHQPSRALLDRVLKQSKDEAFIYHADYIHLALKEYPHPIYNGLLDQVSKRMLARGKLMPHPERRGGKAACIITMGLIQLTINATMAKQICAYLLACVLGSMACRAQENNRCDIIHTILTYKPTLKVHYFDKVKDNIIIVDTTRFFRDCIIREQYGHKVSISHDTADTGKKLPPYFVISVTRQSRRKLAVVLHQKSRGAVSYFTLKERRGRYKVKGYDKGFF